ncbi:hypothetical protein ACKKBF_B19880 [Auxenochlorella protothecoides x Auxenochlorella symbiontica]
MASDCVCNTVALLLEKLQVPADGPLGDEVGRFLAPVVTVLSYPDLLRYPALVAALGSILGRLVEEFDLGLERSEEIYAGVPALLVHPSPAIRAWARSLVEAWGVLDEQAARLLAADLRGILDLLVEGVRGPATGREPRYACRHHLVPAPLPDPHLAWSALTLLLPRLAHGLAGDQGPQLLDACRAACAGGGPAAAAAAVGCLPALIPCGAWGVWLAAEAALTQRADLDRDVLDTALLAAVAAAQDPGQGFDAALAAAIKGLLGPILRGPAASTRHLCGPVTAAGLSLLASERLTGAQLAATSSEWMPALVRSLRGPAPRPTEAVIAALGAAKALLSRDCAAVLASLAPGGDAAGVTIPHYCFPGVWETVASCDDVAAATTLLAAAAELQAGSAAARGPGGGAAQAQPVPGARPVDDSMLGGFIATQGLSSTLARQLDGARQDAARFARFAPGVVAGEAYGETAAVAVGSAPLFVAERLLAIAGGALTRWARTAAWARQPAGWAPDLARALGSLLAAGPLRTAAGDFLAAATRLPLPAAFGVLRRMHPGMWPEEAAAADSPSAEPASGGRGSGARRVPREETRRPLADFQAAFGVRPLGSAGGHWRHAGQQPARAGPSAAPAACETIDLTEDASPARPASPQEPAVTEDQLWPESWPGRAPPEGSGAADAGRAGRGRGERRRAAAARPARPRNWQPPKRSRAPDWPLPRERSPGDAAVAWPTLAPARGPGPDPPMLSTAVWQGAGGAPPPARPAIKVISPPSYKRAGGPPVAKGGLPPWLLQRTPASPGGRGPRAALPPAVTLAQLVSEVLSLSPGSLEARPLAPGVRMEPRFESMDAYVQTMRTLLVEEVRAQLQLAMAEGDVLQRLEGGAGDGLARARLAECQRVSDHHNCVWEILEGHEGALRTKSEDLLVMAPLPAAQAGRNVAGASAGRGATPPPPTPPAPAPCFLLVETVQQEASRSGKPRLTVIKGRLSATAGAPLGSTAILVRVTSLTPHYRQLAALARCARLPPPLQRLLLDPGAATAGQGAPAHDDPLPAPLRNALAARHNASQLAAIRGALVDFRPPSSGRGDQPGAGGWGSGPSLTLVQGPPGTGKTTAILGMVAAFLGCAPGARGRAGGKFAPPCSDSRPASGEAVRVLLCAQSNAAVDELVGRLCQRGILDSYGKPCAVRVLRLGTLESAAPRASTTHIDAIVAEMERAEAGGAGHGFAWDSPAREVQDVAKELKNVLQDIECQENQARLIRPMISELRNELEKESSSRRRRHGDSESASQWEEDLEDIQAAMKTMQEMLRGTQSSLASLNHEKRELLERKKQAEARMKSSKESASSRRPDLRAHALNQAEVVAGTLSALGADIFPPDLAFHAIICDEAAQAVEPASLVPLHLLAPGGKLVLVGDPKQLPATVISCGAAAGMLSQSLFERCQKAGTPVEMLTEQYRMHPAISAWPARFFYDAELVDGPGVHTLAAPFHAHRCFPPLAFFDCMEGMESRGRGGSLENREEAELALKLCTELLGSYGGEVESLVLLAPYSAQVSAFKRHVSANAALKGRVECSTVDGYQGREADVVIFSSVRARGQYSRGGVGFLADARRQNVALTRAKRALWVVGRATTLQCSEPWAAFIDHCRAQGCLIPVLGSHDDLLHATHQT